MTEMVNKTKLDEMTSRLLCGRSRAETGWKMQDPHRRCLDKVLASQYSFDLMGSSMCTPVSVSMHVSQVQKRCSSTVDGNTGKHRTVEDIVRVTGTDGKTSMLLARALPKIARSRQAVCVR